MTNQEKARAAILEHIKETGNKFGAIKCPVCMKDHLSFAASDDDQLMVSCKTPNCVMWFEPVIQTTRADEDKAAKQSAADFAALPLREREYVTKWVKGLEEVHDSMHVTRALAVLADRMEVSRSTARRKYYDLKRTGDWRVLVRRNRCK